MVILLYNYRCIVQTDITCFELMSLSKPLTVDDLLNYRLNRLLASSGAMVTLLCEGRYGITRREWRMICILAAHGAMSPSELAQQSHLERPRVSHYITDLVRKKLLLRVGVPEDKRRARVALTERGEQLYAELFPQSVKLNNTVLQVLSPMELTLFDAALTRLTEVADRLRSSRPINAKADRQHGGSRQIFEPKSAKGLG
jgi:DNA-binding MarR family transcriptional regulator